MEDQSKDVDDDDHVSIRGTGRTDGKRIAFFLFSRTPWSWVLCSCVVQFNSIASSSVSSCLHLIHLASRPFSVLSHVFVRQSSESTQLTKFTFFCPLLPRPLTRHRHPSPPPLIFPTYCVSWEWKRCSLLWPPRRHEMETENPHTSTSSDSRDTLWWFFGFRLPLFSDLNSSALSLSYFLFISSSISCLLILYSSSTPPGYGHRSSSVLPSVEQQQTFGLLSKWKWIKYNGMEERE